MSKPCISIIDHRSSWGIYKTPWHLQGKALSAIELTQPPPFSPSPTTPRLQALATSPCSHSPMLQRQMMLIQTQPRNSVHNPLILPVRPPRHSQCNQNPHDADHRADGLPGDVFTSKSTAICHTVAVAIRSGVAPRSGICGVCCRARGGVVVRGGGGVYGTSRGYFGISVTDHTNIKSPPRSKAR